MLKGKKIILAVTGSIAAYKAVFLLRLLTKAGADVRVVFSQSAKEFVAPLTFSALSGNEVISEFTTPSGTWNNHVHLAHWADFILVAPCSANTLSKLANGVCDNFLLALLLSADCPLYLAPAMDREMYAHPSVKGNLKVLASFKVNIIPAEKGDLASGLQGEGRMAEPENIIDFITNKLIADAPFHNINALVTAGPTHEYIDPVRFIGNASSGKQGFAIAEELAMKGAAVTLIHGPVNLTASHPNIVAIPITSAEEMYLECLKVFPKSNLTVMCAAVADFKPLKKENIKLKKTNTLEFSFEKTPDILKELGKQKKRGQILVGFALETNDVIENAVSKMKNKNLDAIVLNRAGHKNEGPGSDTNKITILGKNNKTQKSGLISKADAAKEIVDYIRTELL